MSEKLIQNAKNINCVRQALKLWLLTLVVVPVLSCMLALSSVMAHDKIASVVPNHSILVVCICLTIIAAVTVFMIRLCKKRSGILYKSLFVFPVLSEKYQTQNYHNTGDFHEYLRHAMIEGNLWKQAAVNDYFDGVNGGGYPFKCFDVRLTFNAIVLRGNVFKGHVIIVEMPWRIEGDPVDVLHKSFKTEGHRQIRNLSAFRNAGFALRFEVSYTDQEVMKRLKSDTRSIKLKLSQKKDKQTIKLPEDKNISKNIKSLESLFDESFAQKMIDIENQTNEIVSIHIQNDKVYISMTSFNDIFEPHILDLVRSDEYIKQRVIQEMQAIDSMIQLMADNKSA